jgi:hypothetical protein
MLRGAFGLIKGEISHHKRTCNISKRMDEIRKLCNLQFAEILYIN